jgi:3-methylfumaryl-CoA hydratase
MSDDFSAWVGRSEQMSDTLGAERSNALSAALGEPAVRTAGDALPLLHHWLYFWNVQPPQGLGSDGHPAKGGFLPPVPLPRRMWAGGRVKFLRPLLLGEAVIKTSTILKVDAKSGRSGDLVFVTVQHELAGAQGVAVIEQQDLVYREPAAASGRTAPTGDAAPCAAASWHRAVSPDSVLLFRYSALTMNGHRIHYDRPYAMDVEAYPALVIHGPLQATLLIDLAARNCAAPVIGFDFRAMSPGFDGAPLHVCGEASEGGATVWTEQGGTTSMTATVTCQQEK